MSEELQGTPRVGVRFRSTGTVYGFDPGPLTLERGDSVVVETERGNALGEVARLPGEFGAAPPQERMRRVVKLAGERDVAKHEKNLRLEAEATKACAALAREQRLQMKVIRVEYSFDGTRATCFFFAEKRVDYRGLARDLSNRLRVRLDMQQLGARDETRLVGGIGPCGRELCCSSWLKDFHAVSVKMAKAQDLSLNPAKLSGMCGRLKCCLRYEYETYLELRKDLPKRGKRVSSIHGDGQVVKTNPLRQRVTLRLESGEDVEVSLEDLVRKKTPEASRPRER